MHKGTWKNFERVVAALFGTKRTSLSGGNSKITRSDTMHPYLFIECKTRNKFTGTLTVLKDADKEKVYKHENNILIHNSVLVKETPYKDLVKNSLRLKAIHSLYVNTKEQAIVENKTPVVALKVMGKHGFYLYFSKYDYHKVLENVKRED
jgi:hypothetical protein